jgi:hypothetical protein
MELGCVSALDSHGRTIWVTDAHRGDGKRFIVRADGLGRSSKLFEFTSHAQGQARIELTDALGLTRSRFIEDRARAALLQQINDPLKKIEASSAG